MMAKRTIQTSIAILTFSFALAGCSQPLSNREKGALIGGGAGAAGGALIGGLTGAPGTGALVGGAAGAVGGALAGDQKDKRERDWWD
ncbi:MAG: glycine zipper domain-containing protein [Candidatus Binatia bacterium]